MDALEADTRTERVLEDIGTERKQQDDKWGEQHHPDGTGGDTYQRMADAARRIADLRADAGALTWRDILREEYLEVLAESDPVKLRAELVQVAAVAACWIEDIDSRG